MNMPFLVLQNSKFALVANYYQATKVIKSMANVHNYQIGT